ncbi:MAG: putative 4-hydroxybenzoate polyprenyltransferase [Ignavibacteriales bacterium]|nr:putative 4-hydroxybenzoate polyprenyltransferase [Ignavibacteriales bacterium]
MQRLQKFLRFIKIEHTLFSLPLIYSGAFLASKAPPTLMLLLLILTAATGARTAALALNRIIDREIDRRNPRTAVRELPSGRMNVPEALLVLAVGVGMYLGSAALISPFCLALSPLPLLIFTLYPYMKRFTALAHFGVGLGLAMAPLGGWFAVEQSLQNIVPGALLSLFTLLWVTGFDIIYSTLDELFDRTEQLYSFSSRYGRTKALRISALLHVLAFGSLALLFILYIKALAALPLLMLSGYLLYLEHKKAGDVELAFFKINAVLGFVVLGMIVVGAYFP